MTKVGGFIETTTKPENAKAVASNQTRIATPNDNSLKKDHRVETHVTISFTAIT
ncbi:MAG: hypothetical protein J6386_03630 [Candidatus Synoicihabitans palmerolidicus]|nr:hypothetical protein [Candidatus Synoicihabitans palmerolidicus]